MLGCETNWPGNSLFTGVSFAFIWWHNLEQEASMAKNTVAKKTKPAGESKAPKPATTGTKVAPPKAGAAPNALQKPLKPSPELAAVVGADSLPRGEVVSKIWEYIKKNNLQNPQNKREIVADDVLRKVFGRDKVTMFEMNKYLAQHLT